MENLDNTNLVEAIRKMKENNTKENQSFMLGEMMIAFVEYLNAHP